MADVKVLVDHQNSINVRIGQQNTTKVVSSISGYPRTITAENVIGGIASVTELYVSGISTFVGLSTFTNNAFFKNGLSYDTYYTYGVSYFNSSGNLVSSQSPQNSIDYSNNILTIDNSGIPSWSNVIDGGQY